jgi:hypothetical protein
MRIEKITAVAIGGCLLAGGASGLAGLVTGSSLLKSAALHLLAAALLVGAVPLIIVLWFSVVALLRRRQ